jgi:hypothetical protein
MTYRLETKEKARMHEKTSQKIECLDNKEGEFRIGPFPMMKEIPLESSDPPDQPSNTPEHTSQVMDTPTSERGNPSYYPPESPKS